MRLRNHVALLESERMEMPRTKIHGERILLNRPDFKWVTLEEDAWRDFEKVIGLSVPSQIRESIKFYLDTYCLTGSSYTTENTVLVTEILPALERWIRAGNSLLGILKAGKKNIQSREAYVDFLDPDSIQTLSRVLPSQLLLFAAQSATAAGDIVKQEIESERRTLPIENDLWSAWVCLTARTLESAGLKISGASTDKSVHESPFIGGIVKLQSFLPKECQHFNGYESIRKATQESLAAMGKMEDQMLLQILVWGMQLPDSDRYPGNLRGGSKDRIAEFESRVKDMQAKIRSRNQKFGFDPNSILPHLRPSSET